MRFQSSDYLHPIRLRVSAAVQGRPSRRRHLKPATTPRHRPCLPHEGHVVHTHTVPPRLQHARRSMSGAHRRHPAASSSWLLGCKVVTGAMGIGSGGGGCDGVAAESALPQVVSGGLFAWTSDDRGGDGSEASEAGSDLRGL